MNPPTFADVAAAVPAVHRHLRPTALIEWPGLSRLLGCRFFLKHENHNPTTAFKVRGGVYLVSRLSEAEKRAGIIACTTGNHGQSLAFACGLFGVRCVLVVPARANPDKVAAMEALGAELIPHGEDFDEAKAHCESIRHEQGLRYVHSANEPDLIAGVGTYGMEIFDALPEPEVILVPVGLGSGICGTALAASGRNPRTRIIGVQSEGAPAVTRSWQSGRMVSMDHIDTFAEGMATRAPAEMTLDIMRRHVADMVLVSDEELRQAIRWILQHTHNLAEGAGAGATAAAWKMRETLRGKTVVGVLSGGNLDLRELRRILGEPIFHAAADEPPDHKQLPESDGSAMPNMQQPPQTEMFNQSLRPVLNRIHPDGHFCMAGDCFIYFRWTQPVLAGCKAPDWFYVPGVPPMLDEEIRRSYVLWKEGVRPQVVIEYVSGDGTEEHDRTPHTGKFWVYEQAIAANYYVIFDLQRSALEVYELVRGRYQPMPPNSQGRVFVPPLQVEVGVWEGEFAGLNGAWLRAWDPESGTMLPIAEERIEIAEERAEAAEAGLEETQTLLTEQINATESERKRASRLAEKLRELGINPDEIADSN